jgi:hypothetical protein
MTTEPNQTGGVGRILGLGALACLACCLGPILGLLGAIGVATMAGTLAFGVAGLTVALLAIPPIRKHRQRPICATPLDHDHDVAVATPTLRRPD